MVNIHCLALLPIGVVLKTIFFSKLIYDTHELETECNGLTTTQKRLAKLIEKTFIRFADQIFVVGENIADEYALVYGINRPVVILNAPPYYDAPAGDLLRHKLYIPVTATIFLYQGGLSLGRGVKEILEAFMKIGNSDAVIVFMGYGILADIVMQASEMYSNIYYMPAVPPNEVLVHTSSADVGIHLIKNTCLNHYYCMPNKLFEYTMAGLPVIVSDMKEMADFVTRNQLGVVASEETVEGLLSAINKLLAMDLKLLQRNARRVAKEYCWEVQEERMLDVYAKMLSRNKE